MDKIITRKVILIGDGVVGKTSILQSLTGWDGNTPCVNTGTMFVIKKYKHIKNEIRLQIWDLLGQPRYDQIRGSFFKGSGIVIMVFDITNEQSFENLKNWYAECKKGNTAKSTKFIVIGNKKDLEETRVISATQAEELVKELSARYMEMSVITKEGMEKLNEYLVICALEK